MNAQDLFRIGVTAAGFICFALICIWAYSRRNRSDFDEAAAAPILDDDTPHPHGDAPNSAGEQK